MSNVAVNDAGQVMILQGEAWQPAPVAQNDQGARVYFDGAAWQPVPTRAAPAQDGGGVMGWLGRRGRDVIEGIASFPSAAADAIVPGRAAQRVVSERMGVPAQVAQRMAPTLSEFATAGADALGLPRPQTDDERMTSAVVQGVLGAVPTMGIGAGTGAVQRGVSYLSQGVGGAAGGAATEGARQAGYGEGAQLAAGLVGGLGGAGAVQAAAAGGRAVGGMAAPFTQRGREQAVADTLLRSSGDPANLRTRIEQSVADPDARLPGSPVTTAVAARDPRLLAVEASVRDGALGPDVAVPVRDAQIARNMAQRAELDALGDNLTPGERGAALRGARGQPGQPGTGLTAAEQARRNAVSRAYEAIDPDGTARLPMAPVQAAAAREIEGRWGPGAGEMPAPLAAMLREVNEVGDVAPWRFLQNVRSRAAEIAGDPAAGARVQATAARIREAIDATAEAAAVPVQRAGQPATLADLDRMDAAQGMAARPDVAAVLGDMRSATADRQAGGISLVQFLRRQGGFRENPGEVSDGRRIPGLFNRQGLTIDRAMQEAIDAGYYPGRTLQTDAVTPGATLTRQEFLRDLGEEINGRGRIFPEARRAAREDVAQRGALRDEVERELDGAGVGLRDDPSRVFAAARPIDEAAPAAGIDRPDGAIVIPPEQRFTPEQAQRWRTATDLRRRLGEDFERDRTGANATGRILATADYGAPRMVDEQVARTALANVSSVRQVLRAGGGSAEVRDALRGQFIADLSDRVTQHSQRVNAEGVAGRPMSPAAWSRIWDERAPIAREIFDAPTMRRLELLSRDFAEASIAANAGRSAGSQTAQNLSVGGLIARASNGLIDPNIPAAQTLFSAGGLMRLIYQAPEQATRELFAQAMADPRFAAMLLARTSPNSVQRATAYIEQNMTQRLAEAAALGAQRQIIRTAGEEQRRQAQQPQ